MSITTATETYQSDRFIVGRRRGYRPTLNRADKLLDDTELLREAIVPFDKAILFGIDPQQGCVMTTLVGTAAAVYIEVTSEHEVPNAFNTGTFLPPEVFDVSINVAIVEGLAEFQISWDEELAQPLVDLEELPKALTDRLRELLKLPNNWDSYGAPCISEVALKTAESLLRRAFISVGSELPVPFVSPTLDGGVGMEWKLESGKELLLEIEPDSSVSYLLVIPRPSGGEDEYEEDIQRPEQLEYLFKNLKE